VPVEGFNPERIKSLKSGMETTLGGSILAAAILDKDYRSKAECDAITSECKKFCRLVAIHHCKEIENFALVPDAIDRAALRKAVDQARRSGKDEKVALAPFARAFLDSFAQQKKSYVQAQYLSARRAFERKQSTGVHEATFSQVMIEEFDQLWNADQIRLAIIPGKEALSAINGHLQSAFGINITPTAIVDAMRPDEIPKEIKLLIADLALFSAEKIAEAE
jgi:hypothetical protein